MGLQQLPFGHAVVRAGANFVNGKLDERSDSQNQQRGSQ